jgi:general secretion pathway protein F/type IV pilus assembly protein PilC
MQIARDAAGNILLAEAIDRAAEAVRSGETLAVPLAQSGLFAEDVVEMIAVGESANNLPVVLVTIADTIDKRVDRMLNLFVRLMEPVLLLMLAGVVVFIFVALIVPMMRMSASLSGG